MAQPNMVTVEFFGIPRQRAGRGELTACAGTAAAVLAEVEASCPGLQGIVTPEGSLAKHYLLSLNGEEFIKDLRQELKPGVRLLLLSADAGG
jgi:molybdopterin converting factor small subunit